MFRKKDVTFYYKKVITMDTWQVRWSQHSPAAQEALACSRQVVALQHVLVQSCPIHTTVHCKINTPTSSGWFYVPLDTLQHTQLSLTSCHWPAVTDKPPDAAALWWMIAIYWPDFATYLPLSHVTPSIPNRVHIWSGKTRMAGLQSGEDRMMIDSVVWARYVNVTNTQTATTPQQQPP